MLISIVSGTLSAQQKMSVLLSNHSFSSGNTEVGTLHTNSSEKVSFKLKGKDAKKFFIKDWRLLNSKKLIVLNSSF